MIYKETGFYEIVEIDGEIILFPNNGTELRNALIIGEAGALALDGLIKGTTENDVIESLCKEYSVLREQARADLEVFIDALERHKVVKKI